MERITVPSIVGLWGHVRWFKWNSQHNAWSRQPQGPVMEIRPPVMIDIFMLINIYQRLCWWNCTITHQQRRFQKIPVGPGENLNSLLLHKELSGCSAFENSRSACPSGGLTISISFRKALQAWLRHWVCFSRNNYWKLILLVYVCHLSTLSIVGLNNREEKREEWWGRMGI